MPKKRIALPVLSIFLLGLAAPVYPMEGAQAAPGDQAAIRALVKRYVESRETGDPKSIAELFTADADQLVSTGEWRKGREAVVAGTVASSANERGQRRTIEVESIRFVDCGVAIADGHYTLSGPTGSRNMWTTIVAKRTADGWRIAAIRNMLPARAR
jgi:uncharacterized protein (TIGR02246 family)